MKLLIVGDFEGNTGPANVNRSLKKHLPNNTIYLESRNKISRLLELLIKMQKVDAIIFSGMSKINIIGIKIAKILDIKTAYLMHGCREIENQINQTYKLKDIKIENKVLALVPKIICVSEYFMKWMKESYPVYESKLTYVNNGIDWKSIAIDNRESQREEHTLLAVGGGLPQKNILSICKAVQLINDTNELNLELIVIGKEGSDTEKILSYSFVNYINEINHEEMTTYYRKAKIFVQNSVFETFGLAPIEALINGCDLLFSTGTGAKSIISELEENDIINDTFDSVEIAEKIKLLLNRSNNERLLSSINKNETSVEFAANKLIAALQD